MLSRIKSQGDCFHWLSEGLFRSSNSKRGEERVCERGKEKGSRTANIHKLLANGNYFQQNDSTVSEAD